MTTIQIKLPKSIARLYPKVGEKALLQALRESVQRLIREEREELKTIKSRLRKFERKYKMRFEAFEKHLPPDGDYKIHEDYGEWSYLRDRAATIARDLASYERLYGSL